MTGPKKPYEILAAARLAAGWKSARSAAIDHDWPESTYRAHESATRNYNRDRARIYAKAYGIDPKIIYLDADEQEPNALQLMSNVVTLPFAGYAEAGVWREDMSLNHLEPKFIRRSPDSRYAEAKQYVYQVVGNSMDLADLRDGVMIVAADYDDYAQKYGVIESGKYVVVEKIDGGRRERTVKEVRVFRDRIELHPRSSQTGYEHLVMPTDFSPQREIEIRIAAIVLEAFRQF